jgi:hypothetical protein
MQDPVTKVQYKWYTDKPCVEQTRFKLSKLRELEKIIIPRNCGLLNCRLTDEGCSYYLDTGDFECAFWNQKALGANCGEHTALVMRAHQHGGDDAMGMALFQTGAHVFPGAHSDRDEKQQLSEAAGGPCVITHVTTEAGRVPGTLNSKVGRNRDALPSSFVTLTFDNTNEQHPTMQVVQSMCPVVVESESYPEARILLQKEFGKEKGAGEAG